MVERRAAAVDTLDCLTNAKRAAVELPRSLVDSWLVWPLKTYITNIWWYGSKWSKTTVWRMRGLAPLVPSAAALPPPVDGFPSLPHSKAKLVRDADERRRVRSAYDEKYAASVVACWKLGASQRVCE